MYNMPCIKCSGDGASVRFMCNACFADIKEIDLAEIVALLLVIKRSSRSVQESYRAMQEKGYKIVKI